MKWLKFMKGACLVAALGVTALLGAPDVARAATPEADALRQSDQSTFGSAIQQTLPAGLLGTRDSVLTKDPVLKLVHCCHAHTYPPFDSNCCHPATTVYVAPRYGYGAAGVRGVSRRTSRRVSRRR